jgi:DtxR family Mn-dependent transcriptional regulator
MLTRAEENYLKSIFHLETELEDVVSTNAIAEFMETKPSSVTDMMRRLAEKELVTYQRYKGVYLTDLGEKVAARVIRRHRLWEVFLVEKLNFQWDEVHEIAEQLEHVQSEELICRLDTFLNNPEIDPHGDPIPNAEGKIKPLEKKLLSEVDINKTAICIGVKESATEFLQFLDRIGIQIGTKIKILSKETFDNSVFIEFNTKRMSLSQKASENLFIKIL